MQTWKRIYRWSFFTGGLIALFWTIYYLITGHVPIAEITLRSDDTPTIYTLSRWWDILIGPICSIIINLIWIKHDEYDNDDYRSIATFFIVVFGIIGIIWGTPIGLTGLATIGFAFGVVGAFFLALVIIFLIASIIYWLINTRFGSWLLAHATKPS